MLPVAHSKLKRATLRTSNCYAGISWALDTGSGSASTATPSFGCSAAHGDLLEIDHRQYCRTD